MNAIVTSQVRIANRAMILLGSVERITSLDDGSPLANQVKDLWHESRRELIGLHTWNFAVRRAKLNRQGDAAFGYASQFQLPADYIRWLPWGRDECDWFEGEEEGGFILCNATESINIRYVADVEDVTRWAPHFQILMAYKLAVDLAESATQISGNVEEARVKFEGADGRGGFLEQSKRLDGLSSGNRRNDAARVSSRWLDGYAGTRRAPGAWS